MHAHTHTHTHTHTHIHTQHTHAQSHGHGLFTLDLSFSTCKDDAVKARKEMGAAAMSALSQLSSLDDILGIGPMKSPPRDQVVPSRARDDVVSKETVNVSMVQSSERTQEVSVCLSVSVCLCICYVCEYCIEDVYNN